MIQIRSDNAGIEKHLRALESAIEAGGGGLHSNLMISSHEGVLTIETADDMRAGREIIRLTRETVLPEDQFEVHYNGSSFDYSECEDALLGDEQRRLMEATIGLYNDTNKASLFERDSAFLCLRRHKALFDVVSEGRSLPKHTQEWMGKFDVAGDDDVETRHEFIADGFLKTRYLGYSDDKRVASVSILMPVVDFLNHHANGAGFAVAGAVRAGDLSVVNAQPVEGSRECYAFYGMMDALDSMLRYDFPDTLSPVVRSVPVELDFFGYGRISIGGPTAGNPVKGVSKAMRSVAQFTPNIFAPSDDDRANGVILNVPYMFIPVRAGMPLMMVRVLGYVLNDLIRRGDYDLSADDRRAWVKEAEGKILEANKVYYAKLASVAGALQADAPGDHVLDLFSMLAKSQVEKLAGYTGVLEVEAA